MSFLAPLGAAIGPAFSAVGEGLVAATPAISAAGQLAQVGTSIASAAGAFDRPLPEPPDFSEQRSRARVSRQRDLRSRRGREASILTGGGGSGGAQTRRPTLLGG